MNQSAGYGASNSKNAAKRADPPAPADLRPGWSEDEQGCFEARAAKSDDVILAPVHATWLCGKCKADGSCTLPGCAPVRAARGCAPAKATTLTNEGEMAMAAGSSMPSALDLSEEWLCDTGAAYDLVPRATADNHTDFQSSATPVNFQTANGAHRADTTLSMTTPALGDDESEAYVMAETPPALSVGQRILYGGYGFYLDKGAETLFYSSPRRCCRHLRETYLSIL